jgi:coenzyme F420-dependent glucose-6-phosphate dehydrogenase
MTEFGYALSSEEHPPEALVSNAKRAELAGFTFALISDHFHPWTDRQGQSPFVWSVIGAIAQATERLRLGTGVTCPLIRTHPAIIAQAAATSAAMMPTRFFLGVGSGENLNEHILGDYWPPADVRLEMLDEAVEIIRLLWQGGTESHEGAYYTVHNARIYTLPDEPPPIYMAAGGSRSAKLAGRIADGIIATAPREKLLADFTEGGGSGKPRIGQLTVCWARDEATARHTAREWWPNAALNGELSQELRLPAHFEQAAADVTEDQIAEEILCGPDAQRHLEKIREFVDNGFDHVYIHQVGPDQEGFFRFYESEVLPALRAPAVASATN